MTMAVIIAILLLVAIVMYLIREQIKYRVSERTFLRLGQYYSLFIIFLLILPLVAEQSHYNAFLDKTSYVGWTFVVLKCIDIVITQWCIQQIDNQKLYQSDFVAKW